MKITSHDILSVSNYQTKPLSQSFTVSDIVSEAAAAELTKAFGKFGVNAKGIKLTKDGFGEFDITPKNSSPSHAKSVQLVTTAFPGVDKDGLALTGLHVEYRWVLNERTVKNEAFGTFWFNDTGKMVLFNAWYAIDTR